MRSLFATADAPPSVAVIGAGPGGSVAALALARFGVPVTLIEQHRFPRDKVCGESISALGMFVLERLGLGEQIISAGAVRLTRAALHAPDGTMLSLALPQPMWGLSRGRLDTILLEAARCAGARILQPARCESLRPASSPSPCTQGEGRGEGSSSPRAERTLTLTLSLSTGRGDQNCPSRITLVVRDLVSNVVSEIHPDWVILADGKRALLPRRFAATNDFGLKGHFTDVNGPRNAVELFGIRGCYGGTAPIEDGGWNVAFSVPKSRIARHGGNLDSLFAEILSENAELNRRFGRAAKIGPWLSSPLPRFAGECEQMPGIIAIGNAAAAIEPIGGEGMGLAMRSAELAAKAIIDAINGDRERMRQLAREFGKLWRTRRWGCRGIAQLMGRPGMAAWALGAGNALPAMKTVALGVIGKRRQTRSAARHR